MKPSFPRTSDGLARSVAPQSGKVVSVCHLTDVLKVTGMLASDRERALTVPLYSVKKEVYEFDHAADAILWKGCQRRVQRWNMDLVPCRPTSPMVIEIKQAIDTKVKEESQLFSTLTRDQFLQKLCGWYYPLATPSNIDSANAVLSNLSQVKYLSIDESSGIVKYNIPTSFTILCLDHIVKKTQECWNDFYKTKTPKTSDRDHFAEVLASTNSILQRIKDDFNKNADCIINVEKLTTALQGKKRSRLGHNSSAFELATAEFDERSVQAATSLLDSLCSYLKKLTFGDVALIPQGITFESAVILLKLAKMGTAKPKTKTSLKGTVQRMCRFLYFAPLCSPGDQDRRRKTKEKTKEEDKRRIIKLKEVVQLERVSLEPSKLLEKVDKSKSQKKKTKADKPPLTERPGYGRKRKRPECTRQNSEKQSKEKKTDLDGRIKREAESMAQRLSTCVIPATEQTKLAAVEKIREIIAKYQNYSLPKDSMMETDQSSSSDSRSLPTQTQLSAELIKACIFIGDFPKEEAVKSLKKSGSVIDFETDGPITVKLSTDTTMKIKELNRNIWKKVPETGIDKDRDSDGQDVSRSSRCARNKRFKR